MWVRESHSGKQTSHLTDQYERGGKGEEWTEIELTSFKEQMIT